ncbi:MAG: tol-pal system protein YbgF [Wenzhouxiangella sp.]
MTRNTSIATLAAAVVFTAAVSLPVKAQDSGMMVVQMQQLLEEIRELRGMVEAQQQQIETLQQRQRAQFLDLDQRLQAMGGGAAAAPRPSSGADRDVLLPSQAVSDRPAPPVAGLPEDEFWEIAVPPGGQMAEDLPEVRAPIDAQMEITPLPQAAAVAPRDLGTPTPEEQAAYDRAFRALREQRFADAENGFADFLDRFPTSGYAPNALYWLAETHFVRRDFENALAFFQELRQRYPRSNKDGDALLKIGFSHFEMRQWNEARAALEQVRSEHPNTTLARLAETRLRDMRLAGHF